MCRRRCWWWCLCMSSIVILPHTPITNVSISHSLSPRAIRKKPFSPQFFPQELAAIWRGHCMKLSTDDADFDLRMHVQYLVIIMNIRRKTPSLNVFLYSLEKAQCLSKGFSVCFTHWNYLPSIFLMTHHSFSPLPTWFRKQRRRLLNMHWSQTTWKQKYQNMSKQRYQSWEAIFELWKLVKVNTSKECVSQEQAWHYW